MPSCTFGSIFSHQHNFCILSLIKQTLLLSKIVLVEFFSILLICCMHQFDTHLYYWPFPKHIFVGLLKYCLSFYMDMFINLKFHIWWPYFISFFQIVKIGKKDGVASYSLAYPDYPDQSMFLLHVLSKTRVY